MKKQCALFLVNPSNSEARVGNGAVIFSAAASLDAKRLITLIIKEVEWRQNLS